MVAHILIALFCIIGRIDETLPKAIICCIGIICESLRLILGSLNVREKKNINTQYFYAKVIFLHSPSDAAATSHKRSAGTIVLMFLGDLPLAVIPAFGIVAVILLYFLISLYSLFRMFKDEENIAGKNIST